MKIVFLDRKTLGDDICLSEFSKSGEVFYYDSTKEYETLDRVKDADIIILDINSIFDYEEKKHDACKEKRNENKERR